MRVFLDNSPIAVEQPTIAAALRVGTRAAEAIGRIVVEATVDGTPIPGEQLIDPPNDERPGVEVRLTTAEPRALVAVTLHDVADAMPLARRGQQAAADAIHAGKIEEALGYLAGALGIWEQLRQVIDHSARLLELDLAGLSCGPAGESVPISRRAEALATHLTEVKRTITAHDWAGLADVLAYDLDPQTQVWRDVLTALAETVRPGAGDAGGPEPRP